jgi:heme exporter protein A
LVHAVRVEGVSKLYGRQRALGGVSLELRAGRLTALMGPNGAGKSTLIGVLSTLVRPSAGRVDVGGLATPRAVRAAIGLLAHDSLVYPELSAVENLRFWGGLYDVPDVAARATRMLDEVGLDAGARFRPARTYSRGMLQRLALARALLPEPKVLLLDEPFTGLDRAGSDALGRALVRAKADGRVVLVATHDLEALDGLAEHVVVLKGGKVVLDEARATPFSAGELRARVTGEPQRAA